MDLKERKRKENFKFHLENHLRCLPVKRKKIESTKENYDDSRVPGEDEPSTSNHNLSNGSDKFEIIEDDYELHNEVVSSSRNDVDDCIGIDDILDFGVPITPDDTDSEDDEEIVKDIPIDPNVIAELSGDKRLIYYTCFALYHGYSNAHLLDQDELFGVVGTQSRISGRRVTNNINNLISKYKRSSYRICNSCLLQMNIKCENSDCDRSGSSISCKRSKEDDYITFVSYSLVDQFRLIISDNIDEMISVHEDIHNGLTRENDDRFQSEYGNSIETPDEFEDSILRLKYSFGTDGFQPEKVSTKHYNMWYARLESLSEEIKNSSMNVSICNYFSYRKKPERSIFSHVKDSLFGDVIDLKLNGLEITDSNGVKWTVYLSLWFAQADLLAIYEIYKTPSWGQNGRCHICKCVATESNGYNVFHCCKPLKLISDKDYHQLVKSAELEYTPMSSIILPTKYTCDRLHLIKEGIIRDGVNDMNGNKPRWIGRTLTKSAKESLRKALTTIINYTYSSRFILNWSDLSSVTAEELLILFQAIVPIIVAGSLIKEPNVVVHLIGVVSFVKSLSKYKYSEISEELGYLLSDLHEIYCDNYTLKTHLSYLHIVLDIRHFGYSNTSCHYIERANHDLQCRVSCFSVSEHEIFDRHVIKKEIYRDLKSTCSTFAVKLLSKIFPEKKVSSPKPMRKEYVSEYVLATVDENAEFWRTYTYGDVKIESIDIRHKKSTQKHNVYYDYNDRVFYGCVHTIITLNDTVYIAIWRLNTISIIDGVDEIATKDPSYQTLLKPIIGFVKHLPTIGAELTSGTRIIDIIPAKQLHGIFVMATIKDKKVLIPIKEVVTKY